MVRKIGEFEKPKFEKSGVIYKGFLRQTQGTKKMFEKLGNSNNRMFEKLGFNCSSYSPIRSDVMKISRTGCYRQRNLGGENKPPRTVSS